MMPDALLLTGVKAAQRLGVSVKALRLLVARGLPRIIVGRRAMFVEAEMAEWLKREAACSSSTAAQPRPPGGSRSPQVVIGFDEACARLIGPRRNGSRPSSTPPRSRARRPAGGPASPSTTP